MKKLGKERIKCRVFMDGKLTKTYYSNLTVYKRRGEEVVHYVTGYRTITREGRQAVLTTQVITHKSISFSDLIKDMAKRLEAGQASP